VSTRAWAYIRVSTEQQADKGLPVEGQRVELQRYAKEHGMELTRIFVDEGFTGGNDHRENFQEMMSLAHKSPPPCDVILLWSWSRFSRQEDDAHYWKASLRRHGVDIRDISGETPQVEGMQYVFESLIHWKDSQRLEELSRDVKRSLHLIARMGYIPTGGITPPKGYMKEQHNIEVNRKTRIGYKWVPDPSTWGTARRAWDMRLAGYTYREINAALRLFADTTSYGTFFQNPTYKGEAHYGNIVIETPAMVTTEEWDKVNAHRNKRRSGAYARRRGSPYLLTGIATCGLCGKKLHASSNRSTGVAGAARYYHCPGRTRDKPRCPLPFFRARELEKAIIDQIMTDVLTPEALQANLERLREEQRRNREQQSSVRSSLEAKAEGLKRTVHNLLDLAERGESPALLERLQERETELKSVQQDLQALRALEPEATLTMDRLRAFREHVRETLMEPTSVAKTLVGTLVKSIVAYPKTIEVTYKLPF